MEIKVKDILKSKGHDVWSISSDQSVFEGLKLMAEKNIGALIVTPDGKLEGIFSERDYARKVILVGKSSKETSVGELMTRDVISVDPNTSLQECMGLFTDHHIRHLPVVEEGKVVGMLTIGDAVKQIITDLQFTVRDLENYITGGGYGG